MKILLDENLDQRLRKLLGAHEVFTVAYKGWKGLRNGELLKASEEAGIDVFLTGDQTLVYEQNLKTRLIAVIALSSIELRIISRNLAPILAAIDMARPGSFQAIDCGRFTKKPDR